MAFSYFVLKRDLHILSLWIGSNVSVNKYHLGEIYLNNLNEILNKLLYSLTPNNFGCYASLDVSYFKNIFLFPNIKFP